MKDKNMQKVFCRVSFERKINPGRKVASLARVSINNKVFSLFIIIIYLLLFIINAGDTVVEKGGPPPLLTVTAFHCSIFFLILHIFHSLFLFMPVSELLADPKTSNPLILTYCIVFHIALSFSHCVLFSKSFILYPFYRSLLHAINNNNNKCMCEFVDVK